MTIKAFLNIVPWHIRASWGLKNITENNGTVFAEVSGRKYTGPISVGPEDDNDIISASVGNTHLSGNKENLWKQLDHTIES